MSPRLLGLQAIAHHLAPVLQRMWSSFHHPCWDIQLPAAPGEDVQGLSHPSQSFLCLQSLIFREPALPWSLPPLCFTLQFLWTWHGFFQGLGWGLCLSEGPDCHFSHCQDEHQILVALSFPIPAPAADPICGTLCGPHWWCVTRRSPDRQPI